jgi:hypothetical protein
MARTLVLRTALLQTCGEGGDQFSEGRCWILPLQESLREDDEEGGCSTVQPPIRPVKGVTEAPWLFVENKDAVLARETYFLHLAVLTQEHRVVR